MINLEKEIREQPSVLASLKNANLDVLKELVKEAKEKGIDNIYLVARGTSDHACTYAQYLFAITMGMNCALGTPSVFTQYGQKIKFNNALVIGVSQSGRAEDVCEVLKSANEQGMTTVAITNYKDSLLATTISPYFGFLYNTLLRRIRRSPSNNVCIIDGPDTTTIRNKNIKISRMLTRPNTRS